MPELIYISKNWPENIERWPSMIHMLPKIGFVVTLVKTDEILWANWAYL